MPLLRERRLDQPRGLTEVDATGIVGLEALDDLAHILGARRAGRELRLQSTWFRRKVTIGRYFTATRDFDPVKRRVEAAGSYNCRTDADPSREISEGGLAVGRR